MYTHILITAPMLEMQRLVETPPWKTFHLVGEVRTPQAATFVFETERPLSMNVEDYGDEIASDLAMEGVDILANVPEAWLFFANCDGYPRQRSTFW